MSLLLAEPSNRSAPVGEIFVPSAARIHAITPLTHHEKLFELSLLDGRRLDHQPGQFVQVSVLSAGECPISICSSPTRPGSFELCIRRVGIVTECIHRLRAGDVVGIRGPLGCGFDLEKMKGQDVLVVAGGLGLAPARSLVQYILDTRPSFGRFDLLFGCRRPGEILFRNDLLAWGERGDVNLHVTVDSPAADWRGHVGVVTTLFKALPKPDSSTTVVVIVGPPVMFKFAVLEALGRGIPEERIYCSLERRMKCGVGTCGHCQVNGAYVCVDGPVFSYGQLKPLREAVE